MSRIVTEVFEIWEEFMIHKINQIFPDHGGMMIDFSFESFWDCPSIPLEFWSNERSIVLSCECGSITTVRFKIIEILEEKNPRTLLDIVELTSTSSIFMEDIIDISEGLFEHSKFLLFSIFYIFPLFSQLFLLESLNHKKEAHKRASKLPIGNICHYIKYRTHSPHFSDIAQAYDRLLW